MQSHEIITRLKSTTKKTEKEKIVEQAFLADNKEFFIGAKLAYDALIRFYVKKVPAIDDEDLNPNDPGSFSFNDFLKLSDDLSTRKLTGNNARDAICAAAEKCHGPTWNLFYRGILRKDLQCGCTETTINKVLKNLSKKYKEAEQYMIPVFDCQLAKNAEDYPRKVKGKKLLDIKLDGVRLLTEIDKEARTVIQYSREGQILENFTTIREALQNLIDVLPESIMLDGEIVSNSFQELMTQINREKNVNTDNARLALFDVIPLRDFKKGICAIPQYKRHEILSQFEISGLLKKISNGKVFVVPKIEVDLMTDLGKQQFNEFNRQALDLEYEGIMIKDPMAPYKCNRNDAWLKKKPHISVSLKIVGFKQGNEGKYSECLGSFICEGYDGDRFIKTDVSGFSEEERFAYWGRRNELLGMIVEVEADAFTKAKDAEHWSLRFPQFKGFRGTKPGEKL